MGVLGASRVNSWGYKKGKSPAVLHRELGTRYNPLDGLHIYIYIYADIGYLVPRARGP